MSEKTSKPMYACAMCRVHFSVDPVEQRVARRAAAEWVERGKVDVAAVPQRMQHKCHDNGIGFGILVGFRNSPMELEE